MMERLAGSWGELWPRLVSLSPSRLTLSYLPSLFGQILMVFTDSPASNFSWTSGKGLFCSKDKMQVISGYSRVARETWSTKNTY